MGNSKPKVSIGIPVFNGETYLAQTLHSLLAQTFTDFELLISDNASTDGTQALCTQFAAQDARVRYYRNASNLGAARNYNRLFELSQGIYFKWAAYDDMYEAEFLADCVAVLDSEPDVVVCYTRSKILDENGQYVARYADGLNLRSQRVIDRFHKFMSTPGLVHPIFGLIRSSALARTPLIGTYPIADRVLLAELVLLGQFYEVPDYHFLRRFHPGVCSEANKTNQEVAEWYDPQNRRRLILPRWRRLGEYLKAISRAPLTPAERLHCYLYIARYTLHPRKWFGLGSDILKALRLADRSCLEEYDWRQHVTDYADHEEARRFAEAHPVR